MVLTLTLTPTPTLTITLSRAPNPHQILKQLESIQKGTPKVREI